MSRFRAIVATMITAALSAAPGLLAGQVQQAAVSAVHEVRVTASDGRLLVQEALAQGENKIVTLTLQPGASAFRVESGRVVLLATAQSGPMICPVRISGVPRHPGQSARADRPRHQHRWHAVQQRPQRAAAEVARGPGVASLGLGRAAGAGLHRRLAAGTEAAGGGVHRPGAGETRAVRAQAAYLAVSVAVLPRGTGAAGCG